MVPGSNGRLKCNVGAPQFSQNELGSVATSNFNDYVWTSATRDYAGSGDLSGFFGWFMFAATIYGMIDTNVMERNGQYVIDQIDVGQLLAQTPLGLAGFAGARWCGRRLRRSG